MNTNNADALVSVIIPVYNCELYLREAIHSVQIQSYSPIEIIVVDDGSMDGSPSVAQAFGERLRYVRQPNNGIGAARNRGIEVARGKYLTFLDADDIWMPDKVQIQMDILAEDGSLDMVFGQVVQFVSPELSENERKKLYCPAEPNAGYHPGAMLIKRESFMKVGPFATDLQVGEFIDWYAKAMEKGLKGYLMPDTVLRRRLHCTNTTLRQKAAQTDYLKVLKASLDRRRARDTGDNR